MKRKLKQIMKKQENTHVKLMFLVFCMCIFGDLMICSASSYTCSQSAAYGYDGLFFVKRQSMYMIMGFVLIIILQYINTGNMLRRFAREIYFVGMVSVVLLLTPLAISSHGASRWVRVVGIQFQPAEILKISVIVMLAYMVHRFKKNLASVKLTIYMWILGGIPAILVIFISSDLSSAVIILIVTFGITAVTNKTWKLHLCVVFVIGTVITVYLVHLANDLPDPSELGELSYRIGRIAAWLNPEMYADEQGYQVLNSLYAVGSGGWFGKGIGRSMLKLGRIPEAHNDMIFAIICEELGILGGMIVVLMFLCLSYLLIKISSNAESLFETVIMIGITLHLSFQAIINMSVTVNLLPNTGVPLPFISYGGTSVMCNLFEIACAVSISRKYYINRAKRTLWRNKRGR